MKEDIKKMRRSCDKCQKGKILHHNVSALKPFPLSHARFEHSSIDICGPLPISNGLNMFYL